jgi:ABC-type Zn uptake system ZnuABC Zn-binding protein ZnuA
VYDKEETTTTTSTSEEQEATRRRIDELLDKIKNSGYKSLTTEEKNFLFEASTRK